MLARQLENNEIQLSDEQRKRLVDVYVEERARVPEPQVYDGMDSGLSTRKSHDAWQEDYQKRVSAEAGRILDLRPARRVQRDPAVAARKCAQNIVNAPSAADAALASRPLAPPTP